MNNLYSDLLTSMSIFILSIGMIFTGVGIGQLQEREIVLMNREKLLEDRVTRIEILTEFGQVITDFGYCKITSI